MTRREVERGIPPPRRSSIVGRPEEIRGRDEEEEGRVPGIGATVVRFLNEDMSHWSWNEAIEAVVVKSKRWKG